MGAFSKYDVGDVMFGVLTNDDETEGRIVGPMPILEVELTVRGNGTVTNERYALGTIDDYVFVSIDMIAKSKLEAEKIMAHSNIKAA